MTPMQFQSEVARLKKIVKEISGYYAANRNTGGDEVVVSKSMLSQEFYTWADDELQVFLMLMKRSGKVIAINGDQLTFSRDFIEPEC